MREIVKVKGIYQIKNKITEKLYVGSSSNIGLRWQSHIQELMCGNHVNSKIQDDFNKYGLTSFEFSILDIITNNNNLLKVEQKYLNTIDFESNYNIYNSLKTDNTVNPDYVRFIDFINKKWLVPKGISDKDMVKYRIYKEEDKDEIVRMVVKCKIINLYYSETTFNKAMNIMKNTLGYKIDTGRSMFNKEKHTYKLIVDFINKL